MRGPVQEPVDLIVQALASEWQDRLAKVMPLEFDGLRLRPTSEADVRVHLQLLHHPKVREHVGPSIACAPTDIATELIERKGGMAGLYVVELLADAIPIGEAGCIAHGTFQFVEVSVMLLPEFQGRGHGATLLRCLKHIWLEQLGEPLCHATTRASNLPAISILTKAGFEKVAEYLSRDSVHVVYVAKTSREAA